MPDNDYERQCLISELWFKMHQTRGTLWDATFLRSGWSAHLLLMWLLQSNFQMTRLANWAA